MSHGGKRAGAGRKVGEVTKKTRAIAERAIAEGISPLEVMLNNMRHFQQVALDAEAILEGLTAEQYSGKVLSPDEQFKLMLAEVKKAAGFRQMAHECARDAASYLHPKLSSIQHSGQIDFNARDVSDDELANIATRSSAGAATPKIDTSKLN